MAISCDVRLPLFDSNLFILLSNFREKSSLKVDEKNLIFIRKKTKEAVDKNDHKSQNKSVRKRCSELALKE